MMVQDKHSEQSYNLKDQDKWDQVINNIMSVSKILKYKCGRNVPKYFPFRINFLNNQHSLRNYEIMLLPLKAVASYRTPHLVCFVR